MVRKYKYILMIISIKMKKIGINLEKTILKEIKEIITHPLIEESKMFQERYDTDIDPSVNTRPHISCL
jgi:hypothetical protein